LESGLALARDRRAWLFGEPVLLTILAGSYLGAGNAQLARAAAEEALALAKQREMPTQEIAAQLAVARVRRRAEGLVARTAIETALERALTLVRETGARAFEPRVYAEPRCRQHHPRRRPARTHRSTSPRKSSPHAPPSKASAIR
jgi:hypothetical protein